MTSIPRLLIESFEYDRWANLQWIYHIKDDKSAQILDHIIRAQSVWLARCQNSTPTEFDHASSSLIEALHFEWVTQIADSDVNREVTYKNLSGLEFTNTFLEISLHVINHGTYHRGQLRQISEMNGKEDFPETDMILFRREFKRL